MSAPSGAGELTHAEFLLKKGDWQAATAILTTVLAADPRNDAALRQLTACHISAGNLTAALDSARAAVAVQPADPRNHIKLAGVLGRLPRGRRASLSSTYAWPVFHLLATIVVIPLIALYPWPDGPPFAIVAAWASLGVIANALRRGHESTARLIRRLIFATVLRP